MRREVKQAKEKTVDAMARAKHRILQHQVNTSILREGVLMKMKNFLTTHRKIKLTKDAPAKVAEGTSRQDVLRTQVLNKLRLFFTQRKTIREVDTTTGEIDALRDSVLNKFQTFFAQRQVCAMHKARTLRRKRSLQRTSQKTPNPRLARFK